MRIVIEYDGGWAVTIDGVSTGYGDNVGEALLAITKAMESITPSIGEEQ